MNLEKTLKNPIIIFISLIDIPLSFFSNLKDFIKNWNENINLITNLKITINMNYFEICVRLLTVFFLFILWKKFLKEKETSEKDRAYMSSEITKNINHLSRITHNKFTYLFLINNFKDLTPVEFADKLTEFNLSKDDLIEIGVPQDFIEPMGENLLNSNQMKKLIEFKKTMINNSEK